MTTDNRSVIEYLNAKTGLTIDQYCELNGVGENGVYKAWNTPTGNRRIKDRIFRRWMQAEYPKGVALYDEL